jgi:hypothetical protein
MSEIRNSKLLDGNENHAHIHDIGIGGAGEQQLTGFLKETVGVVGL